MTTIKRDTRGNTEKITIKGHSGFGNKDKDYDIVCSHISILVFTLLNKLGDMNVSGKILSLGTKIEPGDVEIDVTVQEKSRNEYETVWSTILTGFYTVADRYPNNIFIQE